VKNEKVSAVKVKKQKRILLEKNQLYKVRGVSPEERIELWEGFVKRYSHTGFEQGVKEREISVWREW